ncbi:MAG: toll/interleukin-1 receptor domain-containing protein [Chitinophagaceae bacterium]|nr:toll/interleukin-1 receptor domain-containing protein [Chitinophagaceae bacterium]
MTKEKIFFSYSRADGSEFALRLAVDLKNKGFNVWIDQQDIRAGLEWDTEIEKALVSCDCVLFLETEKSVVSNNVLDEVYYALEQKKKVIPLIYVDSRTPFRLNRLQHIDFTKNYDTGLAQLVNELEGNIPAFTYQPEVNTPHTAHNKSFFTKNSKALVIVASLAVLISAVILFTFKNKPTTLGENNVAISLSDTTNNTGSGTDTLNNPVSNIQNVEDQKSNEIINPIKTKKNNRDNNSPSGSINMSTGPAGTIAVKTESNLSNLNEMVAGDWRLMDIEPKAQSQRGYLKIEASGENKATIKSYMQFYYPDSKALSYLTVFNAFAGCTSCAVNKEMKLNAEDIAVGSRTIKKLEEDQADGKKAGDIIMDANSNKSIRGSVTLQFVDNNNAIIKVKQPLTIALANELMLEPFVYTFYFKKYD